jgi:hypothetical protein
VTVDVFSLSLIGLQRFLTLLLVLWLTGCGALYESYSFTEPLQTSLPVQAASDEVWVTSIPAGADVYLQLYNPEEVPAHATDLTAYRGKTPLRLSVPPGSYWLEVALDAEVFSAYFSPPYEEAQFEHDGATSEALLFQPLSPGERRRVLRYYRLEKQPQQGQTLIALFHPRGEPLERVMALYPQTEQYRFTSRDLQMLLERAQVAPEAQDTLITLMRRGGKAVWSRLDEYTVALEILPDAVYGRIMALYKGPPLPDPLLPDGGGL